MYVNREPCGRAIGVGRRGLEVSVDRLSPERELSTDLHRLASCTLSFEEHREPWQRGIVVDRGGSWWRPLEPLAGPPVSQARPGALEAEGLPSWPSTSFCCCD
jgi:hypothetical protein